MNGTRGLVIATAAAFLVGCSVGLMGGIVFVHFVAPWLHHGGAFGEHRRFGHDEPGRLRGPGGSEGRGRMFLMMERELRLSPEQHQRIGAALDRAREKQMAARESLHVWIESELTPEQRERWHQMQERFERSRGVPWPGGPMPQGRP